jgi:citrate lyase subunit beta/citryl-CoA lyase
MLEKARGFRADALVADLEDSVPPDEKSAARDLVAELVPTLSRRGQKIMVRVNSLDTGRTAEELRAVVSPQLYGVSLGKVDSPWHIMECHRLLSVEEARRGMLQGTVRIIPWIESAAGILSASAIASASNRVVALAFGAEDFTNDMGLQRTESGEEVAFPRALVPITARAAGIVALDTPYVRFRDSEGLRREAESAASLGYKGKFAIHPAQLEAINAVFTPREEDLEYARRVVDAWEESTAQGRGALALDGNMVDVPVVKRAYNLLELAKEISRMENGG